MNRRSEHFFGDIIRDNVEDEYIDLAIIPAKPRAKYVNKHELGDISRKVVKTFEQEVRNDRV